MAQETREAGISNNRSAGVYLGRVVNHLDTTFMGGLEVEILKGSGGGNFREYVQCKYASPFFGQTPYSGLTRNNTYESTQKSYGFWAVPPDVGTQVLVLMPEGSYGDAYWVGCVPDTGMNFMTPGYAGTTLNDKNPSAALPVGEYNKKTVAGDGKNVTSIVKPASTLQQERLQTSGLETDWVRGTNTSSARREAPSMVFGISTPGPQDRAGPTHRYGPANQGSQINAPYNRLGGSSFVMDDGDMSLLRKTSAKEGAPEYANREQGDRSGDDTIPANELVRLQTRSGHQILLHNSEDLIYIAHGSGNSWIEMTANGKIDIYAADSVSIRSENDLNFTAERDINFTAARNINMVADQNYKLRVAENLDTRSKNQKIWVEEDAHQIVTKKYYQQQETLFVTTDQDGNITTKGNLEIYTEFNSKIYSGQKYDVNAGQEIRINADADSISLKAGNNIALQCPQTASVLGNIVTLQGRNINTNASSGLTLTGQNIGLGPAATITTGRDINLGAVSAGPPARNADDPEIAIEAEVPEEAEKAFYTKRVPGHEPWPDHENLNPGTYSPDDTEVEETDERPEDAEAVFPTIQDTFDR